MTLLGVAPSVLPTPLADIGLAVVSSNTAKTIAFAAWGAHVVEGAIAAVSLLQGRRRRQGGRLVGGGRLPVWFSRAADGAGVGEAGRLKWRKKQVCKKINKTNPSHSVLPTPFFPAAIAVIGGGIAGVALAHALVRRGVAVALFEPHGLAAGGTRAAAGLLHPFSPTGAPTWRAEVAWPAALELVEVAEGAGTGERIVLCGGEADSPLTMVRPAADATHAAGFAARGARRVAGAVATPLSVEEAARVAPGLALPAAGEDGAPALHVSGGLVVDAAALVRGVWAATLATAARRGVTATLVPTAVASLTEVVGVAPGGAVVAAGAAVGSIAQTTHSLGCTLIQGATACLVPGPGTPPPPVCLLGATYGAPAPGGAGVERAFRVGATRAACPDAATAFALAAAAGAGGDPQLRESAGKDLLARHAALWPEAGGASNPAWTLARLTVGARAQPPRSGAGRPPLAGCIDPAANWWVVGGLGARGLLHAGWIADSVAAAVVDGGGDDSCLDPELTRWKGRVVSNREREG